MAKLLEAFGVAKAIAAAYTLVLHAALWFPITILGAYYYLRQPLRWGKQVTAESRQEQEQDAGSQVDPLESVPDKNNP